MENNPYFRTRDVSRNLTFEHRTTCSKYTQETFTTGCLFSPMQSMASQQSLQGQMGSVVITCYECCRSLPSDGPKYTASAGVRRMFPATRSQFPQTSSTSQSTFYKNQRRSQRPCREAKYKLPMFSSFLIYSHHPDQEEGFGQMRRR